MLLMWKPVKVQDSFGLLDAMTSHNMIGSDGVSRYHWLFWNFERVAYKNGGLDGEG